MTVHRIRCDLLSQIKEECQDSKGQNNSVYHPDGRTTDDNRHGNAEGHGQVPEETHLLEFYIVEKSYPPDGRCQNQHERSEEGCGCETGGGEKERQGPQLNRRIRPEGRVGPGELILSTSLSK